MRKIFICVFILIPALFQSCKDSFLELEPKTSRMEANYYKTEEDALNALAAIYQTLAVHNNYEFVPIMADIASDDAFGGGSSATDMLQWHQIENSRATTELPTSASQWSRCYSGIYRANIYLEKQNGIAWTNEAKKARFEAEALFCRAYFYWDLVRLFGWVPIYESNLPDVEAYRSPTQKTPADVYQFIAKDLLKAVKSLPLTVPANEKGRITKYAAEALMARIYLYYQGFAKPVLGLTGEWSDGAVTIDKTYVQNALDDIIDNGPYELLPKYADVFSWENQNNAESIFELQYSEKAMSGNWGASYWDVFGNISVILYGIRDPSGDPAISSGWSFAPFTWSLVNEYEPGDPRKDVTVYDANARLSNYTKSYQNTGYFNKKYLPLKAYDAKMGSRELNYPKNHIEIRLADVLLMAAEVYLGTDDAKALNYYKQVRERAMGASDKTSVTLEDIYHERRVELAGEGHRYWDLLRRGLDYTEQKINASKITPSGIPNPNDFTDIRFDKNTWGMLPIPASEIRNTTAGSLKQFIPAYK